MFWGFGMPAFNVYMPPPQQPPQPPQQNPLGNLFGGFTDFLNNTFMHPLFGNPEEEQAQQQQPDARPTFTRSNKKESQKSQQGQKKKKKEKQQYAVGSAGHWKQQGNAAYKTGDYKTAIDCYSKAISLNDSESVFYSNRARCYKMTGNLQEALKDAQNAIELDEKSIKAHLLSGQLLAELSKNDPTTKRVETALTRLTKALTLSSVQKKPEYVIQLNIYIYRAKKLLWYKQFENVRNARIKAITEYKKYVESDTSLQPEQVEAKISEFLKSTNQNVQLQIPDYFCCKITLDLMEDPAITDSGQSYERAVIEEHIERNGKVDPFTRQPISGKLYPNLSLKRAIQEFIDKNPWAYEFKQDEDYRKISF